MTRDEFKSQLTSALRNVPTEEVQKTLDYYDEMIDDRIEDGMTEAEAIDSLESVSEIAKGVAAEIPMPVLIQNSVSKRKVSWLSIVLIVLGSVVWLPLSLAIFSVIVSIYIVMWAVAAVLWCVFATFALCVPAGIIGAVAAPFTGGGVAGVCGMLALCLLGGGLAILMFFASLYTTKGIVGLAKLFGRWLKSLFVHKN